MEKFFLMFYTIKKFGTNSWHLLLLNALKLASGTTYMIMDVVVFTGAFFSKKENIYLSKISNYTEAKLCV